MSFLHARFVVKLKYCCIIGANERKKKNYRKLSRYLVVRWRWCFWEFLSVVKQKQKKALITSLYVKRDKSCLASFARSLSWKKKHKVHRRFASCIDFFFFFKAKYSLFVKFIRHSLAVNYRYLFIYFFISNFNTSQRCANFIWTLYTKTYNTSRTNNNLSRKILK